jgi:3D (Asp-Asp-Asp) domain-containing protein
MSSALVGILAAAPLTTNAAGLGGETLQQGMHNKEVKPLQHQLKDFNYYKDKIDGNYGPGTFKAVRAFQQDHGLNADGIAGPNTIDALKHAKALQHTYHGAPLLDQGDRGKIVKHLQSQLHDLKFYKGDIDGIFGPITEDAVKSFQNTNDLAVDGIAGPDTYKALINNPQKAEVKQSAQAETKESPKVESTHASAKTEVKHKNTSKSSDQDTARTITVNSTAYTADCSGCSGVTATGIKLSKNTDKKVIAVDPDVIPLGSKVYVPGYGTAVAGDTGGAISGNKIDVFFPKKSQAMNWGTKQVTVKIIN